MHTIKSKFKQAADVLRYRGDSQHFCRVGSLAVHGRALLRNEPSYDHSNFYMPFDFTKEQKELTAKMAARWVRLRHYLREVYPKWQVVRDVYFADNSIEQEQFSPVTGKTRRVMVMGPGGDACF